MKVNQAVNIKKNTNFAAKLKVFFDFLRLLN